MNRQHDNEKRAWSSLHIDSEHVTLDKRRHIALYSTRDANYRRTLISAHNYAQQHKEK